MYKLFYDHQHHQDVSSSTHLLYTVVYQQFTLCIKYNSPAAMDSSVHFFQPYCGYINMKGLTTHKWHILPHPHKLIRVEVIDFYIPNTGQRCSGGYLLMTNDKFCGRRIPWFAYIKSESSFIQPSLNTTMRYFYEVKLNENLITNVLHERHKPRT